MLTMEGSTRRSWNCSWAKALGANAANTAKRRVSSGARAELRTSSGYNQPAGRISSQLDKVDDHIR